MAIAKTLSIISLFAAIIAVVILITGNKSQVTGLLSPNENVREKAYSDSALGQANFTADKSSIENLLRSAALVTTSLNKTNRESLRVELLKDEPESGLDRPLSEGGTSIDLVNGKNGQVAVFCKKPTIEYICGAVNLTSKAQQVQTFMEPLNGKHLALGRNLANS